MDVLYSPNNPSTLYAWHPTHISWLTCLVSVRHDPGVLQDLWPPLKGGWQSQAQAILLKGWPL